MPLITFEPAPITKGSLLDKLSKFFKRKTRAPAVQSKDQNINKRVENYLDQLARPVEPQKVTRVAAKLDSSDYKTSARLETNYNQQTVRSIPSDYKSAIKESTDYKSVRSSKKPIDAPAVELKRRPTLVKLAPKEELKRRGTVHDLPSRKECGLQRRGTLVQFRHDEIRQPNRKASIYRQSGKPLVELNK
ncbi:hypothetical protein HDV04_001010 [Boothiomyces sp. JEL0838]|nr:hypothetical protein HDV04_001010 [Boothiomyces sp. JEL0838]